VPPGAHPDFAAAELVAAIFGNAPAGRLHKRLTERQLAAGTFGFAFGLADPGPLFLGAALAPGQDVDVARNELLAAMDAVAAEPITQAELDRARTQWLNDWDNGFNDPEVIGVALSDAIARGDWRLYFLQRDQVKALKLADVQRVAEAHFRRANRTVGTYLPEAQPQRAPAPARLDVAAMVQGYKGQSALAQAETFEATPTSLEARTQRGTLSSGLKFALLPKGARGAVVHAQLTLRFGSLQTLKGQETVASALAGLLDKGGAGLDRQQWRDELDRLRAEVRFGTDGQTLSVSISTVRAHLPAVLSRVAAVLRQPALPADALEELRRQAFTGLEQQRSEPAALVEQALARHGNLYPRGDLRYVSSHEEAVQDVQALTVAQVRAFHERFVSAALGEFSAVGDFDTEAVLQALLVGLAGWGQPVAGPLAFERVPQPLVPAVPVRFELSTPEQANAHLLAELRLPLNDRDPDYAPLLMANYLFGLSDNSRLWTRVREKQGLSYNVRSTMDWGRVEANSRWTLSATFAPANRPAVEAAIREELQRTLRDGFNAQELENGKRGLLNLLRLSRAQDAGLVVSLQQQTLLGRDFKFAQQLDEALARLTPAQVSAAFRKHIQPEALRWAWAGDWAAAKLPPALPSTLTSVP
jgi:zinc protease